MTSKFIEYKGMNQDLEDLCHDLNPRRLLIWKETVENLSNEAKEVVQILLDAPTEVLDIIGTEPPKAIRGAIWAYLMQSGWKFHKIWNVFREIKGVLKHL